MSELTSGLLWVLASGVLGFVVSAVFAGVLRLPRSIYLAVYIPVAVLFFISFVVVERIDLASITAHNLWWGLLEQSSAASSWSRTSALSHRRPGAPAPVSWRTSSGRAWPTA